MTLNFYTLSVIYLVYSFLGWVAETVAATIRGGRFANRGAAAGPFCFIYGTTGVLLAVSFGDLRTEPVYLFFACMMAATVMEWITAKLLERLHRRKWWDYSGKKFNLNGYVCLQYSLLWGALGTASVLWGNDVLLRLCAHIPVWLLRPAVWISLTVAVLDQIGQMPLPPYIKEKLQDKERYQTVYSRELGSAAAPTAGLHFTPQMLKDIQAMGVNIGYVTLHVGLGTFRPVKVEDVTKHKMHTEHYHMPAETAELINRTKANGGRVIAVGTTSCRTIESVATKNGCICEDDDNTSIFIYPGYEFKCMDALITNFHLPESTLIMLVSAFAGFDHIMHAYNTAVAEKYRFFSFGDAMFIC